MSRKPPARPRPQGFTLIEVMIVVAIVGILAAVALPSYTSYMRRSELQEASAQLSTYRITLEQYYQDNREYGTADCANGAITTPTGSRFTYSCELSNSGQGYLLTATGSSARATGYDYTVNHANARATTKFAGATQTGKDCWLVKGSEC